MLLSQSRILGLLLSTPQSFGDRLFAIVLILVGPVLIGGASLMAYSPGQERKERNELDYQDLTYDDQELWGYRKRYQSPVRSALDDASISPS